MKTMKYGLLVAMIAGGLLALNAQAQPADKGGKKGGKHAEAKERGQRLAEELGLNAEQKEKLKPILKEEREKIQGLKDLPQDQRREKAKEIRKGITEKVKPILTPEQFEKWEKLREQHRAKPPVKAEEKK